MRTFGSAAAACALVLAGGVWLATRGGDPGSEQIRQPPPADAPARAAAEPSPRSPGASRPEPRVPQLDGVPEVERHREAIAFRDAVRAFFDTYRGLSESERAVRADAILAAVEAREREGSLLPPEALVLKLGLLRATVDDPAVLESETRQLLDAYTDASKRAVASRAPDPRDERYQKRQAEIAREVMELEDIPSGLSREEHLRDRLRALRTEVYAGGADEPE